MSQSSSADYLSPGLEQLPELGSSAGLGSARRPGPTTGSWPLKSYLELGALPSAVPCARLHAKHRLWEWGLGSLCDSAELVVSELATNAQRASAGVTGSRYQGKWQPGMPPIRLWLHSDKARVLVQVWDGDHCMPRRQGGSLDDESGRGLLLVETLSAEWGAYVLDGATGKIVWALVAREPTGSSGVAGEELTDELEAFQADQDAAMDHETSSAYER